MSSEECNCDQALALIEINNMLLGACKILVDQYNSSGDFTMGGNLTNEGFLKAIKAIKKAEGK